MISKNYKKVCKIHKERGQPARRRGLGLLEKKKDYKRRAKNYNAKKRALTSLERKAEIKNPDEFFFRMANKNLTKNLLTGRKIYNVDEIKNFTEKDIIYLQHYENIEKKVLNNK